MPEDKTYQLDIIDGCYGLAVSLDEHRIAGPKPWGGGKIVKTMTVSHDQLMRALGTSIPYLERLLHEIGNVLMNIADELRDEGDRVYLNSTNDADLLRELSRKYQDYWYHKESPPAMNTDLTVTNESGHSVWVELRDTKGRIGDPVELKHGWSHGCAPRDDYDVVLTVKQPA